MPYVEKYEEPEIFLTHENDMGEFTVYHSYEDNGSGIRYSYSYTMDKTEEHEGFDVRELPDVEKCECCDKAIKDHKKLIRTALDAGVVPGQELQL